MSRAVMQQEQEPCLSTDPSAMRPDFKCSASFCGLIGQCRNKHKPAQRQPLTEKQIVDCWNSAVLLTANPKDDFARAIKAAHDIKEKV